MLIFVILLSISQEIYGQDPPVPDSGGWCNGINEFRCLDDSHCIGIPWRCNGIKNCLDGSDEHNCSSPITTRSTETGDSRCVSGLFKCNSREIYIGKSLKCDGHKDCPDGSDEIGCGMNNSDILPTIHQVLMVDPIPIENIYGREELQLMCNASGYPAPVIEWSFNGVKFVNDVPFNNVEGAVIRHRMTGNRIYIRNVRGKTAGDENYYDTGRYRCIATNSVGSVFFEKNVQIRVMGIFRPGNRAGDPRYKYYPTIGRKFIIECPRHSKGYGTTYRWGLFTSSMNKPDFWLPGKPNPKIFYTRKGELVWSVISQEDLIESRDIGGLQCILTNSGSFKASNPQLLWQPYDTVSEVRKPMLLDKLDTTMLVQIDTEYTLSCGATGSPVPKYRWQYQGADITAERNNSDGLNFELLGNNMQLRIHRVTKSSGGSFKCIAENDGGVVSSTGYLSVSSPPKWIKKFPKTIDAAFGTAFELICNATGFPLPSFELYQNGTRLATKDERKIIREAYSGHLKITNTTYQDNGIYVCLAKNYLETITMSFQLKIHE